jgi:tRNA1Val (adenine37-N6)-methyltransferase
LANILSQLKLETGRMLDIGTGTGLLALMLAQQTHACIDAVEIDTKAAQQAAENFRLSPWADRLRVYEGALQNCRQLDGQFYDLIFCNPPFFNDSSRPPDPLRQLARHTDSLSFTDLWNSVNQYCAPRAYFAVILPLTEEDKFREIKSDRSFILIKRCLLSDNPYQEHHRVFLLFEADAEPNQEPEEQHIIAKSIDRITYTPQFIGLLKEYYLYL